MSLFTQLPFTGSYQRPRFSETSLGSGRKKDIFIALSIVYWEQHKLWTLDEKQTKRKRRMERRPEMEKARFL